MLCKTAGPPLAAPLEHLAHCWNVANVSLFCRYYFGRCSSELAQLVPLPYSRGKSSRYSHYSLTVSFLTQLDSGIICLFPLTYDLNDFKSRYKRHILTEGSF